MDTEQDCQTVMLIWLVDHPASLDDDDDDDEIGVVDDDVDAIGDVDDNWKVAPTSLISQCGLRLRLCLPYWLVTPPSML